MGIKGRRCPTPNGKSEDRPEHSPAVHPALDKCKLAHSTSPFCPWVGQQWTAKLKSLGRKNLLWFVSFAVRTSKSWQVLANSNHRASSNYSTYFKKKNWTAPGSKTMQVAKQCAKTRNAVAFGALPSGPVAHAYKGCCTVNHAGLSRPHCIA